MVKIKFLMDFFDKCFNGSNSCQTANIIIFIFQINWFISGVLVLAHPVYSTFSKINTTHGLSL